MEVQEDIDSENAMEKMADSKPEPESLPNPAEDPEIPTWRLVFLCISLGIGLFLSLLDTTIVATALYTIGVELNSLASVTWVALAYTLAYLGCAVLFARIADITGRRNAFIAALLIFLCFSIGCGFAQTLGQLIACRALQGIGGSGLYSLTFVILPEITPPKFIKWIGGFAGAVVAMSSVLGPVLGGIITHYTTWRWIFWINAPIGLMPLCIFCIAWPSKDHIRQPQRRSLRELDVLGCVIIIAASVLVVFSLQEGGLKNNAWGTALFIVPLIVGILCWALLFGWEVVAARFWEDSIATMFPLRLIKHRIYMAGVLSTMFTGYSYFTVIYSLPIRFQVVNGKSPLTAGIGLLPMLGSSAIGSTIAGALNGKKNRTFPTLLVASCLMVMGTSLLSTLTNTAKIESKTYGFEVLVGFGFGLTVSTASLLAAVECKLRDHSVAQGIVAQVRVLGGSIGIAASTAILGVTQRRELGGVLSASQLGSLQSASKTFTAAQRHAVTQAYSDAFAKDLRVCAAVAGVCVLLTLGTFRRNPMDIPERRAQQLREERERLRPGHQNQTGEDAS